ncbi:MAG: histidine kinase, partial [Chitinophagales bacterium]
MRKYFLIAALFLGTNFQVSSQSLSQKRDSLKIDSIKKILPQLKGTQRIESMFLLCEYYTDRIKNRKINAADTIRFYGNEILDESKLIGYKRGIAMGILASTPDSLREKSARQAMQIGEEISDDEILGWAQLILNSTMQDGNENTANQQLVVDHFNKAGKILQAAYNNTWLGDTYNSIGENEKAFDCARKNLEVLKTIQSPQFAFLYQQSLLWTNWTMSNIFSAAGDYTEALKYMNKTAEIDIADDPTSGGWTLDISGIYAQLGKYDSALMYWNRCCKYDPTGNDTVNWKPGTILSYNYLADLYIGKKQYDKAIEILKKNNLYFDSLIKYFSGNYKHAGYFGKMEASLYLGKAYDSTKNYKAALQCSKNGLNIARRENRRPEMMQGYRLLSSVHHHLGNNDSAYEYLIKYHTLKDSIESKQFLLRIYNSKKDAEDEKKQAQILLLNKDNKIKGEQLKQESLIRSFLIGSLLVLLIAGIFIYRTIYLKRKNERLRLENELTVQRLESEKKHAELKRQASDLQMQALRAQMNPHFIFNSLSSINWFIMENDKDIASDYLTRFSRLMRMVLNAQKPTIPLEDEL